MHSVPTPDFPVSTPLMIAWAFLLLAATAGFILSLIHLNRKGHRWAIVAIFGLLLVAGTAMHVVLLAGSSHTVTEGNWIQLVMVSLVAALEMFIGHTVVFDDIIAAVIFHEPGYMLAYLTIFAFIIAFTLSMVLLIMPRRLRDRTWLISHARMAARSKRKNHIFLGLDSHSKAFARSILTEWEAAGAKDRQGDLIFIEFPHDEQHHSELSIGELISNIFGHQRELSLENQLGSSRFVLLKGRMPESGGSARSLSEAIGLAKLAPWFNSPDTNIYLLSPDEEDNVLLLKYLATDASVKAKILCYSYRVNSYTSLLASMGDRVRVLNLPEMSFNELRQNQPQLHPIHFANIARNAKGESLGYIEKPSTSLLIGFGEAGQEALRYLYEFGSFIDKDMQPVNNTFKVFDPQIESLKGEFLNRTPALRYDANIEWLTASIGSSQFWLDFAMSLPSLTYVVVTVDKGPRNVEIAVQLLQEAARYGKDLSRMCILVRATQADAEMIKLIDFYNGSYCSAGIRVIHPFGLPERIWNLDIATGKSLKQRALACMPVPAGKDAQAVWEERSRSIRGRSGNELLNRQELLRKQAGDIGRGLFAPTLVTLCPESLRDAANLIPDELDPQNPVHFTGTKAQYKVMEYLAASEHLHWMTALEAAGYIDGAGEQDELNKKIKNLVPYSLIPDEQAKHLCWLALKRALLSTK